MYLALAYAVKYTLYLLRIYYSPLVPLSESLCRFQSFGRDKFVLWATNAGCNSGYQSVTATATGTASATKSKVSFFSFPHDCFLRG